MLDEKEKLKQLQRAELRESYLRSLAALANCPVRIIMKDGTEVSGLHKATHPIRNHSIVQEAELPSEKVSYALVKSEEISAMTFTIVKK
ncbi:hypothetical protein HNY73_018575 [Argiope bruennichi]|uniref:Uncharacterized protein n=1 Tax=Argiope bruennichi TaxID=94029 RepID=A0A8T0EE19_ARGBR|nr:hypothetical protein HNY73_018575 [Argiope bruennichi]